MEQEDIKRNLSKWAHSGFTSSRTSLLQSPRGAGAQSIAEFQVQLLKSANKKDDKKDAK
jgi:hypothetical protein